MTMESGFNVIELLQFGRCREPK